jgi:hypothetical protein
MRINHYMEALKVRINRIGLPESNTRKKATSKDQGAVFFHGF